MDYVKELAELKAKISWNTDSDILRTEQYHREVQNELKLKREQVLQLQKSLHDANSKIFDLNHELEVNKSLLKESEFNCKLALTKSGSLEDKLREISDLYTNLKLKEEMRVSEIQVLNDNVLKIAQEKHELHREVTELRDKLKFTYAFQDEMEDRQTRINAIIAKGNANFENLHKELPQLIELEKRIQAVDEFKKMNQFLIKENEKLKTELMTMENALSESTAKSKKLEHLIEKQKSVDFHQGIAQIRFLQWENRCKKLEQKNIASEQIIATLTAALNQEVETNMQLILQNEECEASLQELKNVNLLKKESVVVIEVE